MPPAVIIHCPVRSIRRAFGVMPGNCRFDVGSEGRDIIKVRRKRLEVREQGLAGDGS